MLGAGVGAIFLIAAAGTGLSAPASAPGGGPLSKAAQASSAHTLLHVLLALAVVVVAARALGLVARYFRQPAVIGEVIAGIALGPSLLGRIAPEVSSFVLPASAAPHVGMIAQVGVILYMFLVGLELDTRAFRGRTHTSIAVSHASIVLPFTLGSALALALYPRFSSSDISFFAFALFIGVSMSVTAFPVLTRILGDLQLKQTKLGTIAVACAAVDDVTAWCLLAFVVAMVRAEPQQALLTVVAAGAYLAFMLLAVRPLLQRFARRTEGQGLNQNSFAVICVALLCSALLTEAIGIHALFGAFLLGTLIPHDSRLGSELREKLSDLVIVMFLPAFFAFTGLRTQISLLQGTSDWLWCAAVVGVASLGKFGGSAAAARLTGLGWRESMALGALMNTRGLMELIVLNMALDLGILSPKLFAIFVIMALVTTVATTPLLFGFLRGPSPGRLPQGELASG
ncbi:MAG TPA: cation:proton antiporter [Polyangiaceae bacterium]|nr:cation:proton antiporter [Polyangiaceae bacterium]